MHSFEADILDRFSFMLDKGDNLRLPDCFPAHEIPSEKGFTLKGKNLLLMGANSYLSLLTPFTILTITAPENISIPLKYLSTLSINVPIKTTVDDTKTLK